MERGNAWEQEIVENNGKTKGGGVEGTEGEDRMRRKQGETDGIVAVTPSPSQQS